MPMTEEERKENIKSATQTVAMVGGGIFAYAFMYAFTILHDEPGSLLDGLAKVLSRISEMQFFFIPYPAALIEGVLAGVMLGAILYFSLSIDNQKNYAYKKGEEAGTSRFMTKAELKEYTEKYIPKDPPPITENLPVTYNDEQDRDKYSKYIILSNKYYRPLDSRELIGNISTIVIGGAGSGKSRFYIKPNVLQMNASYVITDPSGEMIYSLGRVLSDHGYKIKIFNISDMEHSNTYNPLHYIRDEAGVRMLIECLITNTTNGDGGGDNEYFVNAEKLLYSACIYYLRDFCEDESRKNFATIVDMINMSSVNEMDPTAKSPLDELFDKLPHNSLAWKNYKAFSQAAGKVLKNIISSCVVRLNPFMVPQVRTLTRTDSLSLEKMGDEKTALFIITPQTDRTYAFLASMLYSQLFETLYHIGEDQKARTGDERLKIPVRCMMDEFANIGEVPEFPSKLATMRKYNISASVVLQDIAQIEAMYKDNWKTLVGNCSTMVFLGTREPNTLEYFSDMLGETTIRTKSEGRSKGSKSSSSRNYQQTGRPVMTAEELGRMPADECIVFTQNMYTVKDLKYKYEEHPYYKQTADYDKSKAFQYKEMSIFDNTKRGNFQSLFKAFSEISRISQKSPEGHEIKNANDIEVDGCAASEVGKVFFDDNNEKSIYNVSMSKCLTACLSESIDNGNIAIVLVDGLNPRFLRDFSKQLVDLTSKKIVILFSSVHGAGDDNIIRGCAFRSADDRRNLYSAMQNKYTKKLVSDGKYYDIVISIDDFDDYKKAVICALLK